MHQHCRSTGYHTGQHRLPHQLAQAQQCRSTGYLTDLGHSPPHKGS